MPLLLACFVALWLPYKYFCFSYDFFLRSRCQQISGRYLLLFVLMTTSFVYFCYLSLLKTSFCNVFACFWLESFYFPSNFCEGVSFLCVNVVWVWILFPLIFNAFCFNLQKCVCAFKWAWKWLWMNMCVSVIVMEFCSKFTAIFFSSFLYFRRGCELNSAIYGS